MIWHTLICIDYRYLHLYTYIINRYLIDIPNCRVYLCNRYQVEGIYGIHDRYLCTPNFLLTRTPPNQTQEFFTQLYCFCSKLYEYFFKSILASRQRHQTNSEILYSHLASTQLAGICLLGSLLFYFTPFVDVCPFLLSNISFHCKGCRCYATSTRHRLIFLQNLVCKLYFCTGKT